MDIKLINNELNGLGLIGREGDGLGVRDVRNKGESFREVFFGALKKVNGLQVDADKAVEKMIVEPGSINIHEVTTLLSQAEMALSMTKVVTDRVVQAYREITNLR